MDQDLYELDDLIKRLEDIKYKKEGHLNYPKAFLTLALEIKNLKESDDARWAREYPD